MALDTGYRLPCGYCPSETEIHSDARHVWYPNCPNCGIFKFQRKTGQATLKKKVADKYGVSVDQLTESLALLNGEVELEPEAIPEPEPDPAPESEPQAIEKKPRKKFFGKKNDKG